MSWSIGYDHTHQRDIGYGVPAYCDHPGCKAEIDRGLGYICGNEQPGGGEDGCGLFFCSEHGGGGLCECCANDKPPFMPSPDHPKWIRHQLTDPSWAKWRRENVGLVAKMRASLEAKPDDAGRTPQKATKAQRQHLQTVANGWLTRSGRSSIHYHAHNSVGPTEPMVDRLEALGWIEWADDKATLTDAGRAALAGGAA